MRAYRTTLVAAALGIAALASSPARADLVVSCTSSTNAGWCTTFGTDHSGNDSLVFSGSAGPYNVTETVYGVDAPLPPPYLLTVQNYEVNVTGAGQISVFVTENGISGTGFGQIGMNFGSGTITGELTDVVRTLIFDYGTANQVLGTCSGTGPCSLTSAAVNLGGSYSLTEEFSMNAGADCTILTSCSLTTNNDKFTIPEPASLGLLGTGLVAFGAWRRRRKAAKKA